MKKLKKFVIASTLALTMIGFQQPTDAATVHHVQNGDTLWLLGKKYGVSVLELKKVNNKSTNVLRIGEKLVIPESITPYEKDLLARLVHAEAKGEPYAGKVAVATVVLNRVDHPDFPNTVKDVIYEVSGGSYAFTPVQNGTINKPADAESYRAVNEALAFRGLGNGSLYFYNPDKISSSWILSRNVTVTIGNHVFAK